MQKNKTTKSNRPIYRSDIPCVTQEIWKPCIHSDLYEISNLGRCRNISTGRVLLPRKVRNGKYAGYTIEGKCLYAHRLVVESFVFGDIIPRGLEINHRDGDAFRNELTNLEICDRSINLVDMHLRQAYQNMRKKSPTAKQWKDLARMRKMFARQIKSLYGVPTVWEGP